MHTILEPARAGHAAPTCVVMLPAAYSVPADFVREGFVRAVRARALALDLVFASLDLRHVTDRSVLSRLRREIILPARAAGSAVWLGGISLGGYIALCYAEAHAAELAGLCIFAPYLGSHIVTSEIECAGGVQDWRPGELAADDEERRVWRFIKARGGRPPTVHVGLGRDDRFARRHRLMAAALGAGDTLDTIPGGHDWTTWRTLWERFLEARLTAHPTPGG